MQRFIRRLGCGMLFGSILAGNTFAHQALTWQEIRARFEAANPSRRAGQIGIEESRANETTAYLRPNPNFSVIADQINPFPGGVRDTIAFSYEHGAASLLDFLNVQADDRSVQVNYLNLVAAYLDAANQLNFAVGREVIQ